MCTTFYIKYVPMVHQFVPIYLKMWTYCQAQPQLNSTQPQLKLRLRSALFPVSDKPPGHPPTHPATQPPSHPATRRSSDLEFYLNSFSARELKFGTDTHYTNLIKIIQLA